MQALAQGWLSKRSLGFRLGRKEGKMEQKVIDHGIVIMPELL